MKHNVYEKIESENTIWAIPNITDARSNNKKQTKNAATQNS